MTTSTSTLASDLTITGISARIEPAKAGLQIPALWQRFQKEFGAVKSALYAVYCDYEGDHLRPYTMVLGVEVEADAPVPADQRRVRIPAGVFEHRVAKGDPTQAVWKTWSEIYATKLSRRFVADYERYTTAPAADGSITADIFVGLRA